MSLSRFIRPLTAEPNMMMREGLAAAHIRLTSNRGSCRGIFILFILYIVARRHVLAASLAGQRCFLRVPGDVLFPFAKPQGKLPL